MDSSGFFFSTGLRRFVVGEVGDFETSFQSFADEAVER